MRAVGGLKSFQNAFCLASTTSGKMPSEALGASNPSKTHFARLLQHLAKCFLRLLGRLGLQKRPEKSYPSFVLGMSIGGLGRSWPEMLFGRFRVFLLARPEGNEALSGCGGSVG